MMAETKSAVNLSRLPNGVSALIIKEKQGIVEWR
jgi:hypothetical protein